MTGPRWLSPAEERAWRGYMVMHPLLDLQIGRDLGRDSGLSTADYMVLVCLSEATEGRLRLVEVAQRMLWSKSRLAHHLDRMAARGLVERSALPGNSRASVIALTAQGRTAIERAAPPHVASVRRHLIDLLTAEQIEVLGDIAETVRDHLTGLDEPQAETDQ